MKKRLVALILVLVAAGGGYYYYSASRPVVEPQILQATIGRGDVMEVVQATGTLQPLRIVPVGSQVSGVVQSLHADYNSIVKRDQVIARLDPSLFEVQVALQTANVERQRGEIANQEVQLENDQKNLERTKAMFEKGLANQQQYDQAQLQVRTRMTQLDSAKKQLLTNEANLNQAKLNLSYTIIRSPIDGVVIDRRVDVGQTVQSSMTVAQFFTLATDLRVLKLQAGVDEADIGKIQRGMKVLFQVDSYGNDTFEGTVDAVRLNAQNQNNVVTYPVWINAPNPDLKLRPSMTANLRIVLGTAADIVRIPNQAIRFRPTNEIYASLGLTPPPAPPSRAVADEAGAPAGPGDAVAARAGGPGLPGANGARATARAGGRGGRGNNGAAVSSEQRDQMAAQFGGRGSRGARGGVRPPALDPASEDESSLPDVAQIDELFAPVTRSTTRASVWTWDPATRKLNEIRVVLGRTDGQFSELVSGDVAVGQQVVTSIILPLTASDRSQSSVFGNQPQNRGGVRGIGAGGGGGGGGGRGRSSF